MIEIAFISDLHLHPKRADITQKFYSFLTWAEQHVKRLYILGDFFDAWAGDDAQNSFSDAIARKLRKISCEVFFMAGNRDFLISQRFSKKCGWVIIYEPQTIIIDTKKVLLMHGDVLCTTDVTHQIFRKITRNFVFKFLFLLLPLALRKRMVAKVRTLSSAKQKKTSSIDISLSSAAKFCKKYDCKILIHGHTHQCNIHTHANFIRYVLSDWDDKVSVLCYDLLNGLYFKQVV